MEEVVSISILKSDFKKLKEMVELNERHRKECERKLLRRIKELENKLSTGKDLGWRS
jgi:hypothetical protein